VGTLAKIRRMHLRDGLPIKVEQVDDRSQVQPALVGLDVGDVATPQLVGRRGMGGLPRGDDGLIYLTEYMNLCRIGCNNNTSGATIGFAVAYKTRLTKANACASHRH